MEASPPPAPGRISMKHGRSANGCFGTRLFVRLLEASSSCVAVVSRSSAARARSSSSVDGSLMSVRSSFNDCREN